MLLSSLRLNPWHSKTDLFWLSRDHSLSPQDNIQFSMWQIAFTTVLCCCGCPVLPLQPPPWADLPLWLMSLLPYLSCILNPFSVYFAVSLSFHQQGCSPAHLENWQRRTYPLMLEEPPYSPSLPVQQILLPLPLVPIYLPKNNSEILFALYKSCKFYDIFLHPQCQSGCSQSPRNTCDTYAQQLTPSWQIPGDTLPSKLLFSVGNGVTFQPVTSRNPTLFHGLTPCPHGWIFVRISWHTETTTRPGNCKVLLPLTTQTDTKYLKSYCKSVSYCSITTWFNCDNSALQRTRTKFLRCHSNDSLALSKALPGWAAEHNLQALSPGP